MNEAVAGEAAGIKATDILALLTGEDTKKKSDVKPSSTDVTSKIENPEAKIEKTRGSKGIENPNPTIRN